MMILTARPGDAIPPPRGRTSPTIGARIAAAGLDLADGVSSSIMAEEELIQEKLERESAEHRADRDRALEREGEADERLTAALDKGRKDT